MRSVSGDICFVRSYMLACFAHIQIFDWTPTGKDVLWIDVICALVCSLFSSHVFGRHPVGILLYPLMFVRPEL